MGRTKVTEDRVLDALTELFREQGYEGVSLSSISEATGLQRASLYHRFPGGKAEMALGVLRHVFGRLGAELLPPRPDETPQAHARRIARGLDAFYAGGTCSCLIETMSLGNQTPEIRAELARGLGACVQALADIARAAGRAPAVARRLAQEALIRIEGALVIARVSGDPAPFQRVLRELPSSLCGEQGGR